MKNFTGRAEIEFPKIRLKLKSICYKLHGELFQVYQGRLFVCPSALLITYFKLRYRLFFFCQDHSYTFIGNDQPGQNSLNCHSMHYSFYRFTANLSLCDQ